MADVKTIKNITAVILYRIGQYKYFMGYLANNYATWVKGASLHPNKHGSAKGIAEGKTYTKIALGLFISKETVHSHIKKIYQILAVNSKAEAIKIAGINRWIT